MTLTGEGKSYTASHDLKERAHDKRSAIDFIMSDDVETWIDAANLDFDVRVIRENLKDDIAKRDLMTAIIEKNTSGTKKSRKTSNLSLQELQKLYYPL